MVTNEVGDSIQNKKQTHLLKIQINQGYFHFLFPKINIQVTFPGAYSDTGRRVPALMLS